MMIARIVLLLMIPLPVAVVAAEALPEAVMPGKHREVLGYYCLDCHDRASRKGEVNLEELSFDLRTFESAEMWQKVLDVMNSGEMPPEDEEQLTAAEKASFLEDLSVTARKILSDAGGVITIRRLNRREYVNTIRELLGVEVDATDLPDDANPGGFDTAGGSLFFSSDQFEQYVKIGRRALDEAIVAGPKPKVQKVRREAEVDANNMVRKRLRVLERSHERAEAWRNSGGRPPTEFGFIDEARVEFEDGNYQKWAPGWREYLSWPEAETGAVLASAFQGAMVDTTRIPAKSPPGRYLLKVRIGALPDAPWHRRFLEVGTPEVGAGTGEIAVLDCFRVAGTVRSPQVLEIPVRIGLDGPRAFGLRERQHNNREAARYIYQRSQSHRKGLPDPALWIDWVEVEGPLHKEWPPAAHREIFFKGPNAAKKDWYARKIIERFASRAFRIRQPSGAFLDKLMELYRGQRGIGLSFEEAIKEPLSVILASPSFLYLAEPAGERRRLTGPELSVRLSFLLWSAPPDEALAAAGREGGLADPEVLRAQVDRMLAGPRAAEFISGFAHQWLHMERLDFFQFNYRHYPQFDESTKEAARREVYETIRSILDDDLRVGTLLKADFVVVNDLLASYYGLKGVTGRDFRKVAVPKGMPRGGLLGMAAVLAMGSDGERSSPVERGSWVMRYLLHDPPPPAPANVPQLSRNAGKLLGARDLLEVHMEEPQCFQCHRKIDPIGYGLENFDAAGKWRTKELVELMQGNRVRSSKYYPIDTAGTLPDGTAFDGFFELRDRIAEREDAFARGLTEALIEYGMGRPYGFTDLDLANEILDAAVNENYRFRTFIHALVQSDAFQTK
jgi:hypothetical protein